MILENKEIADAIIEYLSRRGIHTDASCISLAQYSGEKWEATIDHVELAPKEGPYR